MIKRELSFYIEKAAKYYGVVTIVYTGKTFDNLAVNYADVAKWWV